jgi:hypothetical protein
MAMIPSWLENKDNIDTALICRKCDLPKNDMDDDNVCRECNVKLQRYKKHDVGISISTEDWSILNDRTADAQFNIADHTAMTFRCRLSARCTQFKLYIHGEQTDAFNVKAILADKGNVRTWDPYRDEYMWCKERQSRHIMYDHYAAINVLTMEYFKKFIFKFKFKIIKKNTLTTWSSSNATW